jgi:hypothetical protein
MEYLIAVFKSRTQVMKFYEKLLDCRIPADIVNTPREASLGCGLSVKFGCGYYFYVKKILYSDCLHSFVGIFKVTESGNHLSVRPL